MKTVQIRSYFWIAALAFLSGSISHAANIVWTNTASGNWNATNSWSPNQVPSTNDTAFITNAGTYTVTLNVSATVAGLVLGTSSGVTTQTFANTSQTLTLNGQATVSPNGALNFTNSTLAGAAVLAGTMNMNGVTLAPSGSLTVAVDSVLNLVGTGGFAIAGPLTNNGTVNWLGGQVQVQNNNNVTAKGGVWNQAGAQWYIQCSGQLLNFYYETGYEIFNNAGLFCKTNVTGTTQVYTYMNNTGGTVQAQIGTIEFQQGCNLLGTFQAASGAAIEFNGGNFTWNGTEVFEGPGSVAIISGTVTITTPLTSPFTASGVTLSNLSNLQGSAYLTNVTIEAAETIVSTNFVWAGAQIAASGSLTVSANSVLNLVGGNNFAIAGPLTNNGTVNWLGGQVQVQNNNNVTAKGVIWNQAGAQWYIQCSGELLDYYYETGYEIFNNAGLFCKTNVAGTTQVYTYMNNTGGTVQAQIGTIEFQEGCNLLGTFQAASGAAIEFNSGNYSWNGTAVFEGPGSVAITGGTVTITSPITSPFTASGVTLSNLSNLQGSAYLTNVTIEAAETIVSTNFVWAGAQIAASGSLTVSANSVLNLVGGNNFAIAGPLTNNGTVNWLGGQVQVQNNNNVTAKGVIWNQAGAQWYIQCSAEFLDYYYETGYEIFNNAGLFCKTNVAGTTQVYTYMNNTGGTVQAQIGTIEFQEGCNLLGTFQAASGAAIEFNNGNYLWNGAAVFEGPGSVAITGGTVTISSPITSPFSVSGVTISNLSNLGGSAYLTNVTIVDAETIAGTNINLANSTLAASGSLTVASNGVLNLIGSGGFTIAGPLTNNGTVNWLGGQVQVQNNNNVAAKGVIWNQAGAQWYIQCSGELLDYDYATGYEIFNNAGLLCKTNVTGTTQIYTVLNNTSGTVDAEIGTINFEETYTLGAGGALSFGLNSLSSFGEIALANTAPLNGALNAHLNNGYVPVVSNAFTVLSYGAFTGGFNQTNFPLVAVWQTNQTATALTIKVLKLVPQFKWPTPANIVYGTALSSAQLDATAASPTNLSGTLAGTFSYTPPLTTVLESGNSQILSVTFTPTDLASNSTATTNVAINVLPAPLTITATNRSKTYGQTETFAGTEFAPSGLVNGDTVTSVSLASAGDPPTSPVSGSPYTITITNAVGDAGLTNYLITYDTGDLTVNPAPLTVTANAQSKTYGQMVVFGNGSTLFANSALQNGETIGTVTLVVSGNGGAGTAAVAGSPYTITPSAATGGTFTPGNYAITYDTGTLIVNKAALNITANAQTKTYGQTVAFGSGSALFTPGGLQNGETIGSVTLAVSGSGGAGTASVAGSPYTITPSAPVGGTFTAGNYAISYTTGNLTVNTAALSITANAQSKTYGQTVAFGSGSTLFTPGGLQNGETIGSVTLAVSGNGGAATASVAGSPYTITPSAAIGGTFTAGNYAITYDTGNLTVSGAALTVTANAQSKTYGQTVVFGSGSTLFANSALQNGETIGSVTLAVSGNGGAATASVAGSPYTITPSAAAGGTFTAANYAIIYDTGNLTVNPASLTITASAQSKSYGQTLNLGATLFTTTVLSNSDTVTSVTLNSLGAAATATVAGSTYTITPSAAVGTGLGNYTIAYHAGNLTVNAALLTITANAQTKTYGQTVVFGSGSTNFSRSGLQNGDTIGTVTLAVSGNGGSAFASVSGSPYTITPSAATGGTFTAGNYAITYDTGLLTVTLPLLNLVANPPNIVLSWTTNASLFVLNRTANLAAPVTWTPVTNGITVNGTNNTITISASGGNQFYSLIAPLPKG